MKELYKGLKAPMIITDIKSAELIKHASNAFLALKISFANALANVCERSGANVEEVVVGMGLDKRIGKAFLKAGIGYGGSCFPKDTKALCSIAASYGYEFKTLEAVVKANKRQRELMVEKIKHHLDDLKGKTIAFEDPGSTSAYFVPASILIREGMKLVYLTSPREKPPANMVGYIFSKQEINSSTLVHKGLVDAGAFNNLDWDKDDHLPKAFRKDMKIFYKTKRFPRAVEVVRKDLDPSIKQRLKEILLNAENDPKAKKALRAYHKTKKFDELDGNTWAMLDEVRRIMKIVQSELE